ncbi:MAG: flagellar biosynthesis anti-sigma factor FlgM [Candidatus Brocadiaceae bacterium]|nr:flagellar biosynthesis anti-sigma factor FlgM [Candidatus Brocadiaceae bacterium]
MSIENISNPNFDAKVFKKHVVGKDKTGAKDTKSSLIITKSDSVSISKETKDLGKVVEDLKKMVRDLPDVRNDRVEEVRERLKSEYYDDHAVMLHVADKMADAFRTE